MRPALIACATLLVVGCSDLPVTGDGIVALEIATPTTLTLVQGASTTLIATPVDAQGEPVSASVTWSTPDTSVTVSEAGVVTAVAASGVGRVQAAVGTLRSNLITFTLQAPPAGP